MEDITTDIKIKAFDEVKRLEINLFLKEVTDCMSFSNCFSKEIRIDCISMDDYFAQGRGFPISPALDENLRVAFYLYADSLSHCRELIHRNFYCLPAHHGEGFRVFRRIPLFMRYRVWL